MLPALLALLLVAAVPAAGQPALDAACRGLDRVQVAHPTNCGSYLVCCSSEGVPYECLRQKAGDATPYPRYGTAQRLSYYNAFSATCERFDETGALPEAVCGNFNRNAGPLTSEWAQQVCTAKEAYEALLSSTANETLAAVAAADAIGAGTGKLAAREEVRRRRRRQAPLTPNGARTALRALLQAPGNDIGLFQQIINPDLGRSSTGSLAIHAAMVPTTTKILVWGRIQPAYEPGMYTGTTPEVSSVYDYAAGTYVKAPMRTAPFCSGHSHTSDGTIVVAGGDWANNGFLLEGRYAVRTWSKDGTAWTTRPEGLAYPHWYPTQLTLPDDRVLAVGGYASEADPPVPAIEVWDGRVRRVTTIAPEPFLQQLGGLNLYPTVLLLPWTNAPGNHLFFVFACNQGRVMSLDPSNNLATLYATPAWPTPYWCSAFSALGSATILRLDADTGFAPELAMWGGSGGDAGRCACDLPANNNAYRLPLSQAAVAGGTWNWAVEEMPEGRNMVDNVLLPSGQVLLVNGAKFGNSNGGGPYGGSQARDPSYSAWLYNPYAPAGARFKVMATSPFKRLYHSVAMLLPDASVLVAGSEQDECVSTCFIMSKYLDGFQAERFLMPYFFLPLSDARPTITGVSAEAVAHGGALTLTYAGAVTHAVIAAPAAVTHQTNMNQRLIKLATTTNAGGSITVVAPPNGLVAVPGWWMLFLMNGDIPCRQARWIRITPSTPPPPAPGRAAPGALLPATSSTFEPGSPAVFTGGAYLGALATFNFADGGLAAYSGAAGTSVTVNTPGTATWHVQVFGPYVPLSPTKRYTVHFQIRASTPAARATVTWLREGDYLPFGTTSFAVDTVFKDFRLYNLVPPAAGNYHLQFEFGLAAAGTTFYLDDIQVFDLTLPPSLNTLPPVNDADGGAGGGGGGTPPPPPPPPSGGGTLVAAASEDFSAAPFKYSLAQFEGATATASFAGGAAAVTVTKPGAVQWHLQLVSPWVDLAGAPATYAARLLASASAPASVNVLWLRQTPIGVVGTPRTFTLGPTPQLLELPSTSFAEPASYHLQIEFGLVAAGTTLTFDTIEVFAGGLPTGSPPPPPPPPPSGGGTLVAAASEDFSAAPFKYSLAQFEGATATASFAGGAAAVTVAKPGAVQWHLQLVSPWADLAGAPATYAARLLASASAPASVNVLWLRQTPIGVVGTPRTFTLGATPQVLELPSTSFAEPASYHLQIEIGLVAAGTTLTFDTIEVFAGGLPTGSPPPPSPPPPPPPSGGPTVLASTSENFDGPAAPVFSLAQFADAKAAVAFTAGVARVTVGTPGTERWHLQLKGPSVTLDAALTYTITATVSASAPSSLELLWLREAPAIAPLAPASFAVGTAPATITLPGVKPATSGPHHVQFEFGLAAAGTVLTFDSIVVTSQ
ncbi:glyoxal or galactose oxidase [Raphidocelis subcapitata]|uniref:Glyoxal or galactose oxidase n=1 Tax=Raphidocelis subcapitata TaxID=307507 RepID=A0A2V0NW06_9CHLO|nr:glyoxal or galactose oxidase [Raphidocelis subcapitata]|eukprot:GBF91509.1 glyoxal or galactose oxidase [Raphidocelis subcapitata]